ncbi:MAG TPA: transferrin receptor-like dimerization domain-containing protein [Opitutaceae bacterium]
MRTLRAFGPALAAAALLGGAAHADPGGLLGFRSASAAAEIGDEKAFDAALDPADLRAWMEQLSSEPNQVGSPHDKANADFMLGKFKEWGWDARIETFYVLYPTAKAESLELVAPVAFTAKLMEGPIAGDRTSDKKGGLPPYNVYGADGDVTADLVYVNFGMPEDYAELERRSIVVKGRIVIARYGGGWRGLKAKLAQEHGALGCIIYSDPHEDGYWAGDVYPKGGYRPEDGVQRGSVADITQYSGDPLTPGVGATQDAKRIPISEAKTLPRIPVLPISYGDAKPLLAALEGPVAPPLWRGALPLTYHIGPGPARVHLAVSSDWSQKPIYDVIAVMDGSLYPNEWVLRGNHHDAWVFGAWDPLAGNVAVMAEAKAIGALAKSGWRPKRTIVYCSWDGEEPGLLGSTEWAEAHADELRRSAVLYVNSDTNARGFLFFGGSHAYEGLVNEVARTVADPETGASVLDRLRSRLRVTGHGRYSGADDAALVAAAGGEGDLPPDALGGGSDYTPFLQHLGISTIDLGYVGEDADAGVYHSTYDSFDHYVRFGDPTFAYGVALAQTAGRLVLRTADADVLPMRLGDLAAAAARYVSEVEKLADAEREDSLRLKRLVEGGDFKRAADPGDPYLAPAVPGDVPPLDFSVLKKAAAGLTRSARAYDAAFEEASSSGFRLPAAEIADLNALLQGFEQSLLSSKGLPSRGWYQHMLYAPGLYTGYGAKTLPAVREAIELRRWSEAGDSIALVAETLGAASRRLDAAAGELTPRLGQGAAPAVRGETTPTPTPPPDG